MKDGGSAFPALNFIVPSDLEERHVRALGKTQGMTLRDYFAAAAMQAHIAGGITNGILAAESSYRYADAMLAEREKERT